jgi:hypothetical protein
VSEIVDLLLMTRKKIETLLKEALLNDGEMSYALYEHELEELIANLQSSMKRDKDEYIFTVTENRGDVAMLLIEKSGELYVNEEAREKLKSLWLNSYAINMKKLIPVFARQLQKSELPINGVKVRRR